MLIKKLSKILIGFLAISAYSISLAAVDHFEIELSPNTAGVGEAIDITIKALDKDGNVDKSYVGEILIFSQSDPKAEFPGVLSENTYKFKTSDEGQVKFENAVKFTKSGVQDINVFDVSNEDVFGSEEISISDTATETLSGEIKITSPNSGTTLGTGTIKINGETLKNYKVVVTINNSLKFETISNSEGKFEVNATEIPSGQNSIKAEVLDADGKTIATSESILVTVESMAPSFKELKVTPEGKVEGETPLNVEVKATAGLSEVSVMINDVIQKLSEGSAGVYTGTILAPKANGTYKVDVTLKNELGLESKQAGAKEVIVENVELNAAATPNVEVSCEELAKDLVIKGVKLTKMKSKSVLAWDKLDKASSYNVYKKNKTSGEMELVQNVVEPRIEINISGDVVEYDDFTVKAVLTDEKCNIESADFSQATRVQTGPKEMLLFALALLLTTGIFYFRRKRVS